MTTKVFPNWNELYGEQPVERMPWYYPELDPDLEDALATQHIETGRALDLGTGPATQALALAERGFQVTASDLSQRAIEQGRTRSTAKHLDIEFVQDDILNTVLAGPYDFVFDRGCFHVLAPEHRAAYATAVANLVKPRGYFFLKCFSDEQPGEIGPYRLTAREIESTFAVGFEIIAIARTIYHGTLAEQPKAFFCTLRRSAS
jgi:2-polyprenyl-3-methyl-5-hydroxy-6-metoxy-1,4-benzoquinol methylase